VDQLIQKLYEKDAWKDANLQSTGRTIIELYAYVAQLLLYYLKRSYEEMFVNSAQYWESLCRLANMVESPVKRPIGCSGKVKLVLEEQVGEIVVIPRYTKLICDGVLFYTTEDVVFEVGETEKEVFVRQGAWIEKRIVSSGDVLRQDYVIGGENASDVDVSVVVGERSYAVVQWFMQTGDDLQAKVWTDSDRNMIVTFLRGFGMPRAGEEIVVKYTEVDYEFFPSLDSQWSIESSVRLSVVPDLKTFSRGAGWEDVESFRERLQGWFGVGHRLVTKEDFWHVVKSVEGVGFVQVVDVKDNLGAPFREVEIYLADSYGEVPSVDVLNRVKQIIEELGSIGVSYVVKPVQLVEQSVYLIVYVSSVYNPSRVKAKVIEAVEDLYKKVNIQEWIAIEKLRSTVLQLEGVRGVIVVEPRVDKVLYKGQRLKLKDLKVNVLER